ncbi:alpha/beta-hydrolase [Polyporus arcularius HHB13444]|uniref:Alpha/beta-hydrolase n=1 Tax=Polyporus arcularius HHB13444 TaxID=1314778 RepID=A0A5C3NZR1_9APHY|nr:alpha/beta-hydrolase [Polyporus arcularius HHB13444]
MPSITVDDSGTELAYLDSGVPSASPESYVTIFALHGIGYGYHIYDRLVKFIQDSKPPGVRFVAVSRRGYPGSTPYDAAEVGGLPTASDDQKAAFLRARGAELAAFIDKFIQEANLPPVSADGSSGGIALMGWSLGCAFALSVVSHIDTYPQSVQARLGAYLRTLILHESPLVALGVPEAPQSWTPQLETSIRPDQAGLIGVQWLTSYFKHPDLSSRSFDGVEWVVPATYRAPTIYNMSDAEIAQILTFEGAMLDATWYMSSAAQLRASYERACFGSDIKSKLPHMKISVVVGDATLALGLVAAWQIEDDSKRNGTEVKVKWIKGGNHLVQWDDPSIALQSFIEVIV